MPLPEWTEAGLLPPGAHAAKLPDLYDRFVLDAPGRQHRELTYAALDIHLRLIQRLIPAGKAWIDGSFATRRELPPEDVDVVIHPADWEMLEGLPVARKACLYGLLTLHDVFVKEPAVVLSRLQPVGGMVDAYLCRPGHETVWSDQWARVMDDQGAVLVGQAKGYAEVTW